LRENFLRQTFFYQYSKYSTMDHQYDMFLSHRQATAQDLANAIRLELTQIRPELRIYLDVEDCEPLSNLEVRIL
jgi:hypothetical protein